MSGHSSAFHCPGGYRSLHIFVLVFSPPQLWFKSCYSQQIESVRKSNPSVSAKKKEMEEWNQQKNSLAKNHLRTPQKTLPTKPMFRHDDQSKQTAFLVTNPHHLSVLPDGQLPLVNCHLTNLRNIWHLPIISFQFLYSTHRSVQW